MTFQNSLLTQLLSQAFVTWQLGKKGSKMPPLGQMNTLCGPKMSYKNPWFRRRSLDWRGKCTGHHRTPTKFTGQTPWFPGDPIPRYPRKTSSRELLGRSGQILGKAPHENFPSSTGCQREIITNFGCLKRSQKWGCRNHRGVSTVQDFAAIHSSDGW